MSDLRVELGNIIETPTVFPEEEGLLEITLTNQGNEDVEGATFILNPPRDSRGITYYLLLVNWLLFWPNLI